MPSCVKCSGTITNNRNSFGILCQKCNTYCHSKCVNVLEGFLTRLNEGSVSWLCQSCQSKSAVPSNKSDDMDSTSLPEIRRILIDLRSRIINIENSQQFSSQKLDDLSGKIDMVTTENIALKTKLAVIESKYAIFDHKINELEYKLDLKNRESIQNNLVIFGLPDAASHCEQNVNCVLQALQVPVSKPDIVSTKVINSNSNTVNGNLNNPLVVIKLANKQIKDSILNKFRAKKSLSLSELTLPHLTSMNYNPHQKIILTHHLSSMQSKLYAEAKRIKLKYNFRYLWVQDNNILLRRQSDTKIHRISSFNDINYMHRLCEQITPTNSS